jgi:DNA-binding response OmpR family regulator
MRILLVEDDRFLGAAIQAGLSHDGVAVDWVLTGQEVEAALRSTRHELLILDLGLPDMDGEDLLRRMRAGGDHRPVLVVTSSKNVRDRIQLLDLGADDFLVKPIDIDELAARMRAVLRRSQAKPAASEEFAQGPLKLSPTRRTVTWHDRPVTLTSKEFWVLEFFMRKRSHVVSRAQLEESLYGWGDEIESNAIEVYIHRLRRKICPEVIQTIRGVGYRLGLEGVV